MEKADFFYEENKQTDNTEKKIYKNGRHLKNKKKGYIIDSSIEIDNIYIKGNKVIFNIGEYHNYHNYHLYIYSTLCNILSSLNIPNDTNTNFIFLSESDKNKIKEEREMSLFNSYMHHGLHEYKNLYAYNCDYRSDVSDTCDDFYDNMNTIVNKIKDEQLDKDTLTNYITELLFYQYVIDMYIDPYNEKLDDDEKLKDDKMNKYIENYIQFVYINENIIHQENKKLLYNNNENINIIKNKIYQKYNRVKDRLTNSDFYKKVQKYYKPDNLSDIKILIDHYPFYKIGNIFHDIFVNYYINSNDLEYNNKQNNNYNIYVILSGASHSYALDKVFHKQGFIDVPITTADMSIKNYLVNQNIISNDYNDLNKIKKLLNDYFTFKLNYNVEEVKESNLKKYKLVKNTEDISAKLSKLNNYIDENFEVDKKINLQCKYPLPNKGDLISTLYLKYLFDNSKASNINFYTKDNYMFEMEFSYTDNNIIYLYKEYDSNNTHDFLNKVLNLNSFDYHSLHSNTVNIESGLNKINLLMKCPYCVIFHKIPCNNNTQKNIMTNKIKGDIRLLLTQTNIQDGGEITNNIYTFIEQNTELLLSYINDNFQTYKEYSTSTDTEETLLIDKINDFYKNFGINSIITTDGKINEECLNINIKLLKILNDLNIFKNTPQLCNVLGGDYTINCASIFVLLNKFWYVLVIVLLVILFYYIIKTCKSQINYNYMPYHSSAL